MDQNPPRHRAQIPCLLAACFVPALGLWMCLQYESNQTLLHTLYSATKLFILVFPIIATWYFLGRPFSLRLSDGPSFQRILAEGAASGILIGGLILTAFLSPIGAILNQSASVILDKVTNLGVRDHFLAFALVMSIGHSLLEEYYWRGFVYGQLRELLPGKWAHVLSGVAFALHHIVICTYFLPNPWGFGFGAIVALGGIAWSLLYKRHGSIYGAWLSHLIVDLVLMSIIATLIFKQ